MRSNGPLLLLWAHEHAARAHRGAAAARLANEARRRDHQPLRQRLGQALIALGRRLATEPSPRLARSS
ncbi:MAG TPA: hypothetical protein VKR30_08175 [Candidatus Limnocylindrales bacterium]|nr:hypothetical protein [Candidatus Limnocylindrales bacterium]